MYTVILIHYCKEVWKRYPAIGGICDLTLGYLSWFIYVRFLWKSVQVALSVDCQHTLFVWHTFCYFQPISPSPAPRSSSPLGRYWPTAAGLFRPRYSYWGIQRMSVWPPVPRSSARKPADFWRRCRILNVCIL